MVALPWGGCGGAGFPGCFGSWGLGWHSSGGRGGVGCKLPVLGGFGVGELVFWASGGCGGFGQFSVFAGFAAFL